MVAAIQRIADSISEWRGGWAKRHVAPSHDSREETNYLVGEYRADYSELSAEELAASDLDGDAMIARSRVVSSKRL